MASYYLKAAASYLDRSNISANYTQINNPANSTASTTNTATSTSTATGENINSNSASNWSPITRIGLWTVHRAIHNSTNKLVSVWTAEKRLDSSPSSALSSLPGLVNAANSWASGSSSSSTGLFPLSSTSSMYPRSRRATGRNQDKHGLCNRPITGCLKEGLEQSDRRSSLNNPTRNQSQINLELDEVETQKGLLQIGKGLQFLHESAKLVHCNLTPEAIIINAKGDWKISGFGLSTYLKQPDGQDTKWVFPEYDHRLPDSVQRNFDYLAPEYCLDEHLSTSNDIKNSDNLGVLRAAWSRVPDDVQEVLTQLVTRTPSTRLMASGFLNSRYFSSNLLVSTLAFLDRDTFNSKQNEEHVQFMKETRQAENLTLLIEECRKHVLLPFLLPNIFYIAQQMESEEFRSELLPHLTRFLSRRGDAFNLFCLGIQDLPALQEKALKAIPALCETLEYTLTEKLVPLLARIKTKEPAVMIATLAVHEEMGKKVELTAIATLILPQLWAMSIGPLLKMDQFNRFMNSIEQLSNRVRQDILNIYLKPDDWKKPLHVASIIIHLISTMVLDQIYPMKPSI
ncbi:hypothetical protein KEM48_012027 [Puccinia striiformis f. sp. tritici PST-130]|nr:hypothetical protein KEM48_012027 [Puccinia striiformis f. sp. tritici PST-130]